MIRLEGQVALVTAASKGLGAEIVRELARAGADVAFTWRQDEAAAASLQREVESIGRRCEAIQADARSREQTQAALEHVQRALGRLDALVANAGGSTAVTIERMTEAEWRDAQALTLDSAFFALQAAAPLLRQTGGGRVVLIGSINGLRGRIGSAHYNAAKAGLIGLAKTAAHELGQDRINVNVVAPGYIETPSQRDTPELIRKVVRDECAIPHLGTPGDIAPVVAFLCSAGARHITGEVIKVDAGQYI